MNIQIVGLGSFGLFIARHLVEAGFHVGGSDINSEKQPLLESAGGHWGSDVFHSADVVILSIFPEQMTRELIAGLAPNALLVNVSSVQQTGITTLVRADQGARKIFSFHPLFGPVLIEKSGWLAKQIIVTRPQNDKRAFALLETFTRKGVVIDQMSAEEHDEKMVPHALAFLVGKLVRVGAKGVDPRYLTGSGRHMLDLLEFTDKSPELTAHILSNPALRKILPELRQVLDDL